MFLNLTQRVVAHGHKGAFTHTTTLKPTENTANEIEVKIRFFSEIPVQAAVS